MFEKTTSCSGFVAVTVLFMQCKTYLLTHAASLNSFQRLTYVILINQHQRYSVRQRYNVLTNPQNSKYPARDNETFVGLYALFFKEQRENKKIIVIVVQITENYNTFTFKKLLSETQ